jgi:hypothetical protein
MRFRGLLDVLGTLPNRSSDSARFRWRITGLAAVGVAGLFGLILFALQIGGTKYWGKTAKRGFNSGEIVHSEPRRLWIHPVILKLAEDPPEDFVLRQQEQFETYAKKHGLESAIYVLKVANILADGRVELSTTIRDPSVMPRTDFPEFFEVLQAAGGRPSHLAKARIGVIPPELLRVDRSELLYGLECLENRGHEERWSERR